MTRAACQVAPSSLRVNGFVNETRRNRRDGVERGVMASTGDSP
jgi:hypothetical protein